MTKPQFHALLVKASTTQLLRSMVADNARVDAERAAAAQREQAGQS